MCRVGEKEFLLYMGNGLLGIQRQSRDLRKRPRRDRGGMDLPGLPYSGRLPSPVAIRDLLHPQQHRSLESGRYEHLNASAAVVAAAVVRVDTHDEPPFTSERKVQTRVWRDKEQWREVRE